MRNWDIRECCVRVNLPSPIWHEHLQILCVLTPMWGVPNAIRQVIPLISHIRLDPPHHSNHHLHLSFSCPQLYHNHRTPRLVIALCLTMPWSWVDTVYSILWVQSTPSTVGTKFSIHRGEHTPSKPFTEYSIHPVQHTPSTASTENSVSSLHFEDYHMTPECSFSFRCASQHDG